MRHAEDGQGRQDEGLHVMRPSRGMGAIRASKMPKAKTIRRKDNPDKVTMYAKGGKVRKGK